MFSSVRLVVPHSVIPATKNTPALPSVYRSRLCVRQFTHHLTLFILHIIQYNPVLFGCYCLFRHVLMVNLESSVGVTRMIRPSVLKLATPSMPISEPSISVILLFCLSCHERLSFSSSSVPIRCLAFEVKSLSVSKVRPLSILCRLDLCTQTSHLSSQREDSCNYAHSVIELKIWMVQHQTGENRQERQPSSTSQGATEPLPTLRRYLEWFAALFLCLHLQASAMMTL